MLLALALYVFAGICYDGFTALHMGKQSVKDHILHVALWPVWLCIVIAAALGFI